ncbi:kinase non-catalytic C-lobe domain-containing protein 1 isoform X5 [Amblyraja radiata]|uniref:kinase non-catalytic C-lobe domain-containing protein 1 isoform X5 n=1 Tax=Amblyraja radiata TaxID=386614 RepID=UPI001403316B|nr:kinase non-catalytic C-lobe domain-containing protein 1 isoform X5 [Amblyraja radiata]
MALYYDEDDEREYYEFEPLPTLLEDEENVSLADILSLRDSCLSEQDIWAACLECCLSMRSIAHTPLFHTLCITPDTLAFNANGNVCFMEQLSDDPEGAFVPPEFDVTGNTFEAHAYSLGATLAAAAEYVIEPELKPNLSKELKSLLDQMQQEKPEERPDIEIVLSTCEEKLKCLSSDVICRNLSAIGRRVLSIESVGAFQDGSEETYKEKKRQAGVGHELQTSERNPADGSSSTEDLACDLSMLTSGTIELVCQAEKDAQDVDPDDSTTEILEVLQQDSEDTTNAAEKLVGNEGVLSLDLADAIADGKTKGEQADSILSLPSKRSSTRKRILPKLPTEMADSAQQQLHSKMDLDGSFTPVPSPVSLSNIAAESLYSLDILSSKDCSQEAQFRTQNNDVCFLARNSLPFGRLSANSSSEHIRKVASVEAINKNLSSILNSTFDESSEQFVKYSSVIGKKSSIKKLKSKFSPISVPSSDTPSQLGPLPPCGILLESSTAAGHCSNNVPATRGHFFNMSNHISSAARTSGSNHRNDSKQSHSSSVNDLSQSNVLLFRNITQHCEDEDIEPLPPIRATDNCPAEYPGDQQCISLKELLSEDNKSLRDHELWALCHECLISLKHCKDYPEYLCLESAYIDPSGEVLFVSSVNNDNLDSFYLAPEFVKQGVITEKVCVYGVAAILWTAAKFNAPLNQKLPLSKNLKMLLLDMAKRTSAERPSITEALKICNEYLINRGIDSREVLIFLRNSVLQNFHRKEMTVNGLNYKTEKLEHSYSSLENATFAQESSRLGFVPLAIDSKLTAVKGPIPCQVSVNTKSPSKLPEAFTSPATHFKPIILTQSKEKTSTNALNKCPGSKEFVKATKEGIQNKQGAMPIEGEYILSLKSLKFSTFSSAISEKFYDLYWDDSLLERLYEVVNGSPPYSATLSKVAIKPVFNDCNPTLQNKTKEKKLFLVQKRQRGGKDAWDKTMLRSEKETVDMETREICKQPQLSRSNPPELKLNHLSDNLVAAKCKEDQLQTNADVIHRQDISNTMPNATDLTKLESGNGDEKENISKHLHPMESSCQITAESCISFEGVKLSQSNEVREGNASLITESSMGKKRCNPGWKSAMFGIECFNQQMKTCKKQPDQLNSNEEENIEAKLSELEQQLMMEIKNFRKTKTFYQKLLQQEKGCKECTAASYFKGTDAKMLLPKLKQELQEIKVKVEQLDEEKKYLKMLRMELWSLDSSLLLSLVSSPFQLKALDRKASDSISFLTFHVPGSDQNHSENKTQVLQAGTVGGLMAYLYSSNAVMGGYVQQFFYTFRYFTSPCEFLQFLQDRFNSVTDISLKQKGSPDCMKVYNRSLDLLQAWIEECYSMDFVQDAVILHKLETFVSRKVIPIDVRGQYLINLLKTLSDGKMAFTLSYSSFNFEDMKIDEDNDSVHSVSIKCSDEDISRKSFKWKITKSTESSSPHHKERCNNTAAAPPRPCYNNFTTEHLGVYQKPGHKDHFTLAVYSAQHIAQQLTLLQQELFQDCHPVHFLNSRSFGINDTPSTVLKSVTSEVTSLESNSLFVPKYKQHQHLRQLIKYADNVSHWVSAEIVTCNTCKSQSALLSKFLSIGKFCYEWRNFATAMQILSSLENLIVRQLPSWKSLSSKALEIMEELTGVQVFLKSDSLCLMVGDSFKTQSTIPCARILAMHVQQLEIGAFTMANGTYKWPKLRKIAKVISQIRAFQEKPYMFTPDLELQTHLRQQISNFSDVDVHALAAENKHNFYQCPTERHSRKIQDTLRKMKATFQ